MAVPDATKSITFNLDLSSLEKSLIDTFSVHQPQPIRAVEKTIKSLLLNEIQKECQRFENFISASITIHEFYNVANRTLAYLSEHGLTLWYVVIETKWKKPIDFDIIDCSSIKGLKLIPFRYSTIDRFQNDYKYDRKTKVILKTQLNQVELPASLFFRVLEATRSHQDFLIYTGKEGINGSLCNAFLPHYFRNYDNKAFLCSCTKKAYEQAFKVSDKQPTPKFIDNICHLCKSKNLDRDSLIDLYGGEYLTEPGPFIKRLEADGLTHRTAIAEFARIFKTSKWKNEAELYAITKVLFPSCTIIREYNPKELHGLRIDIFIKELNLAIEYQGQQHFEPIKAFGGEEAFKELKKRDALKKNLCKELNYDLKYFTYKEKLSIDYASTKLKKYLVKEKYDS